MTKDREKFLKLAYVCSASLMTDYQKQAEKDFYDFSKEYLKHVCVSFNGNTYYYDEALLTFSCVPRIWTMVSRKNYIVVQVISDDVFYVAEIDEKHRLELRNLPWDLVKANLPVYGWIVVVNDSDMVVKSRKVKLL